MIEYLQRRGEGMKKLSFILLIATVFLMGVEQKVDGEKVFDRSCASCHIKMITAKETKKVFKTLKAPPMVEVSGQLKKNIKIVEDIDDEIHRAVVIAFIKDYVIYPHLDKSMCQAMALEKFGLMPSLKDKLSEEELNTVAAWVYDFYVGKKF
jgi:uncharacterized pyridoxamine 5'-phosphate oxidase family protein